jgi:hypothetical protein
MPVQLKAPYRRRIWNLWLVWVKAAQKIEMPVGQNRKSGILY